MQYALKAFAQGSEEFRELAAKWHRLSYQVILQAASVANASLWVRSGFISSSKADTPSRLTS